MSDLVPGLPDSWLLFLLVIAAAGPFVALAGHGTIAWVAIRRFFERVKARIDRVESTANAVAGAVVAVKHQVDSIQIPSVPTVKDIIAQLPPYPEVPTVEDIIAKLPPYPDLSDKLALLEEKLTHSLTAAMDTKWAGLQDQLSERVGRVVQANIASAKAVFASGMKGVEDAFGGENDGSMLTEIAGMFMDEDSVKKLSKARSLFKRFQQGGLTGRMGTQQGGQAPQGGFPYGSIQANSAGQRFVATPQGWLPLESPKPASLLPPAPAPLLAAAPIPAADLPPELPPEPKA